MNKFLYLVRSDLYRYFGNISLFNFFKAYRLCDGFKFSFWLRACAVSKRKKISKCLIFPLCRFFYKHYKYKFGYDIPFNMEIGPGLQIHHIGGIVITAKKCGRNLTISQNVTVGMKYIDNVQKYPILGDDVYLAPGCAIIGDVAVGNNVVIGTNSVVTKSIDNNSIVIGIPGKVISQNGAGEYVKNRWVL